MKAHPAGGTAPTPPATAHDHATAREFADFIKQETPPNSAQRQAVGTYGVPDEVMSRALSMGFGGMEHLEDKLALLKSAKVDDDMIKRLRTMAHRTAVVQRVPQTSPVATTRVIGHLLHATSGSSASPVGGCHLHSAAVAHAAQLIADNKPRHLLAMAEPPHTVGPVTYNAFEQWRWPGGGTPGPRPTTTGSAAGTNLGGWILATEPKTTFDNLPAFLAEADAAWAAWRSANAVPTSGNNHSWRMAAGSGRQEIGGYFNIVIVNGVPTPEFISIYPYRSGGLASW
jgi:hypothetical protein